jgi:hypothetical protein
MLNPLAPSQLGEDVVLLVLQLRRDDPLDGLPDHLLGRVAEHPRRAGIPRGDDAAERLADDRVVRGRNDCGQPRRLDFRVLPLVSPHCSTVSPALRWRPKLMRF